MMAWVESEALGSGYTQLALRIRSAQQGNQAMYESLGFAVAGSAPHPLGGPETLTRMEKRLTGPREAAGLPRAAEQSLLRQGWLRSRHPDITPVLEVAMASGCRLVTRPRT